MPAERVGKAQVICRHQARMTKLTPVTHNKATTFIFISLLSQHSLAEYLILIGCMVSINFS